MARIASFFGFLSAIVRRVAGDPIEVFTIADTGSYALVLISEDLIGVDRHEAY